MITRLRPRPLGALLLVASALIGVAEARAQQQPIRGFPADALAERSRLESILRDTPDTALLREYMLVMTEEPHHSGSPASRDVAEYVLSKFREWGLDAEIEEFEALMPFPVSRHLELVSPTRYVATLQEPEIPEDKDSGDENQLPTYNAYAADGDVTGELVFVNYGLPDDYEELDRMGIDVRGKIVIAKFGRSWRGIKPKVAAEHGAIGCLIYSDPEDDGYYVGEVYPDGPMRPKTGVQRGSIMDWATYPGDPLTPGWGAKSGGRKLAQSEAGNLASIPVLPISYGDAQPLLEALGGAVAPNDHWKGALPITYRVGPGPARVRLSVTFDWQVRPLYNVIARIPGTTDPDQWLIHGNHHDAWVSGARDPVAGAVAQMETARSFSKLLETGWRPRRTLIFGVWDGEEWGLLGSTEWAEQHRDELMEKAVAYFNSDAYTAGRLGAGGSHTLETFMQQVARDVPDPSGGSALETRLDWSLERARSAADSVEIRERGFRLGALGSGSDYSPFLDHLTLATVSMGYGGRRAGVYHSIYDSYDHYTRFMDPTFAYGKAQAGVFGTALARMLDAPVLPFSFTEAARTYREYADELTQLAAQRYGEGGLDMSDVYAAVRRLGDAGEAFDEGIERVSGQGSPWLAGRDDELRDINKEIYQTERDLANPDGLPRREWFRHTIYAPGLYTGYGVKTMPGIRESLEWGELDQSQNQASSVAAAIVRMAERVERLVEKLGEL
jgi:N-acetylated-alpha-linked acidic dipeptidase